MHRKVKSRINSGVKCSQPKPTILLGTRVCTGGSAFIWHASTVHSFLFRLNSPPPTSPPSTTHITPTPPPYHHNSSPSTFNPFIQSVSSYVFSFFSTYFLWIYGWNFSLFLYHDFEMKLFFDLWARCCEILGVYSILVEKS